MTRLTSAGVDLNTALKAAGLDDGLSLFLSTSYRPLLNLLPVSRLTTGREAVGFVNITRPVCFLIVPQ